MNLSQAGHATERIIIHKAIDMIRRMLEDSPCEPDLEILAILIEARTGLSVSFLAANGASLPPNTPIGAIGHDADEYASNVRGKLPLPEGASVSLTCSALRWWTGCNLVLWTTNAGRPLPEDEVLARVVGKSAVGKLNLLMQEPRDVALARHAGQANAPRTQRARISAGAIDPYEGSSPFIFLSYSRGDAATALPLAQAIRRAGVRLWWDVALVAGSPFKQKIEQKLRQSSATIVILAASSLEEGKPQEWVYQESALSAELGRELVPVRTDDTPLPLGWRALVLHRQIIDARGSALSDAVASIVARGHALGCC